MSTFHAYENLSVTTASTSFTAATYGTVCTYAEVVCETGAVRFRLDGTAPTASSGVILYPGEMLVLDGRDQVTRANFISKDGVTATLRSHFGVS